MNSLLLFICCKMSSLIIVNTVKISIIVNKASLVVWAKALPIKKAKIPIQNKCLFQ